MVRPEIELIVYSHAARHAISDLAGGTVSARHRDRVFVVDAGANTVAEVLPTGKIHVIAFIPSDPVRDSTPTCITQGPDGALCVGTLDLVASLFAFGPGQSHAYRIDPNTHESFLTAAHVWASGLTTVFGCAFDRQGNLRASEMFEPDSSGAPATWCASRSRTHRPSSTSAWARCRSPAAWPSARTAAPSTWPPAPQSPPQPPAAS